MNESWRGVGSKIKTRQAFYVQTIYPNVIKIKILIIRIAVEAKMT